MFAINTCNCSTPNGSTPIFFRKGSPIRISAERCLAVKMGQHRLGRVSENMSHASFANANKFLKNDNDVLRKP